MEGGNNLTDLQAAERSIAALAPKGQEAVACGADETDEEENELASSQISLPKARQSQSTSKPPQGIKRSRSTATNPDAIGKRIRFNEPNDCEVSHLL